MYISVCLIGCLFDWCLTSYSSVFYVYDDCTLYTVPYKIGMENREETLLKPESHRVNHSYTC